jgi:DNA-binding PucR family transcriptional regulator
VQRALEIGLGEETAIVDCDRRLSELILGADPEAIGELRRQVLAPLAGVRPAVRRNLVLTLRWWLLSQGRRDAVAAELHVSPQTVRYRLAQLRERYGDRLEDPQTVFDLTVALGIDPSVDPFAAPTEWQAR